MERSFGEISFDLLIIFSLYDVALPMSSSPVSRGEEFFLYYGVLHKFKGVTFLKIPASTVFFK